MCVWMGEYKGYRGTWDTRPRSACIFRLCIPQTCMENMSSANQLTRLEFDFFIVILLTGSVPSLSHNDRSETVTTWKYGRKTSQE